jgi:hypothetical protein
MILKESAARLLVIYEQLYLRQCKKIMKVQTSKKEEMNEINLAHENVCGYS